MGIGNYSNRQGYTVTERSRSVLTTLAVVIGDGPGGHEPPDARRGSRPSGKEPDARGRSAPPGLSVAGLHVCPSPPVAARRGDDPRAGRCGLARHRRRPGRGTCGGVVVDRAGPQRSSPRATRPPSPTAAAAGRTSQRRTRAATADRLVDEPPVPGDDVLDLTAAAATPVVVPRLCALRNEPSLAALVISKGTGAAGSAYVGDDEAERERCFARWR